MGESRNGRMANILTIGTISLLAVLTTMLLVVTASGSGG